MVHGSATALAAQMADLHTFLESWSFKRTTIAIDLDSAIVAVKWELRAVRHLRLMQGQIFLTTFYYDCLHKTEAFDRTLLLT